MHFVLNVDSLGDGVTFPQRCFDEDTDTLLGGCQRWADSDAVCQRWTDVDGGGLADQADSDSSNSPPSIVIMN